MKPSKRVWSPEQRDFNEKLAGIDPMRDPYELTHGKRCPACREPTARPYNVCVNEYCIRFGQRAGVSWRGPAHVLEGILAVAMVYAAIALPALVFIAVTGALVALILAWEV